MAEETRTALGSAHERFMRSLPDRGRELQELVTLLEAAARDERAEEQLRRRLHALYASAQVFQEHLLLGGLKGVIDALEAARDGLREPSRTELASVLALCRELGAAERASKPSEERTSTLFRKDRWSVPPETAPVAIDQTVAGTLEVPPDVIAVLVVASPAVESAVRDALQIERCDLTSTSDPETARLAVDQVAPDVVLVETKLLVKDGADLVRELRGARAGSVRAVVALVPEPAQGEPRDRAALDALFAHCGVDASLRLPFALSQLYDQLMRLAGRGLRAPFGLEGMTSGTVEEIARGVAEEIRRGIADSLRLGRGERIELHERSELLAAAWSAVARIRAHLMDSAAGRLRFDDAPYPGGPAALPLTDDLAAAPYVGVGDTIAGRRIVLADDDPAVLWFFAGLLSEAGAIVIEARNGKEALEALRRKPPDLLISDILMPEIDGFTLCRELKRDLALCHVPVILLSWKEDFLQRMRELEAGAVGYLRKEAGSLQILVTVADALRGRAELHALLAQGDEVQGRTDALGVPVLLQAVAEQRPDACVTVRDAWNMFEIDVRGGTHIGITRTAADGSFARGAAALRQLIGVDVGRFAVEHSNAPVRGMFEEPLDKLLADGVRQLGAVLDAVSDSRLMRIARVGFDDEILSALLSATPTALADAAARLRAGESPQALVMQGAYAPREVEQHLRELARRGAILSVAGEGGEDLVESARRARDERPGALMHAAERPLREAPVVAVDEDEVEWVTPPTSAQPLQTPSRPPPLRRSQMPAGVAASAPPLPMPAPAIEPEPEPAAPVQAEVAGDSAVPRQAAALEQVESAPEPSPPEIEAPAPPQPASVAPQRRVDPPSGARTLRSAYPAARGDDSEAFSVRSKLLQQDARESPAPRVPGELLSAQAPASSEGARLAVTLAALVVVGFLGWRALQPRALHEPVPRSATAAAPASSSRPAPAASPARPAPTNGPAGEPVASGAGSGSALGRTLPFIDHSRNVTVGSDQGLLVVEFDGSTGAPRVSVAGRDLGAAPLAAALPAGRHELTLKSGDATRVRYFLLRAGETQIVELHE